MPIWKLTPLSTDSLHWDLSTHRGEAIVRAKNEREARQLATERFAVAVKRKVGHTTPLNPWEDTALVSCEAIQTNDYQDTGPAAILIPRQ